MKAIIIAAGKGRRLLPFTEDMPKCMLQVRGKPLIEHQLDIFKTFGITDISIIKGYQKHKINYEAAKTYYNDNYDNNNILRSLFYAEKELNDDVIVSYSDIIFDKDIIGKAMHAPGDICIVVDRDWKEHDVEEAEKTIVRWKKVKKIGKHLAPKEANGEFIGIIKCTKKGAHLVRDIYHDIVRRYHNTPFQRARSLDQAYLTDMLQELIDRGNDVHAVSIRGGWIEIDTPEDLARARAAKNYGSILQRLLNGVKHTVSSFAKLHHVPIDQLEAVIKQKKPLTSAIIEAVEHHTPLNAQALLDPLYRHTLPVHNDTIDGAMIFTARQRDLTMRTFERGPREGKKIPYYDYADTAMSKTSSFRPEWIKERYVHDGINPNLPDWAFNNGHFEHQVTYFIGSVNFHWKDKNGKQYVKQMQTGDTNYITPFVPHSFTTRRRGKGVILAVTYGGAITTDEFQLRIQTAGLPSFIDTCPHEQFVTDALRGIVIKRRDEAFFLKRGNNSIATLISDIPYQPCSKMFEYIIGDDRKIPMETYGERWGYNIGNEPILLSWGETHEQLLEPGASFFMRSYMRHAFQNVNGKTGTLMVMEIKPMLGDPLKELALIHKYAGKSGVRRAWAETKQWFN